MTQRRERNTATTINPLVPNVEEWETTETVESPATRTNIARRDLLLIGQLLSAHVAHAVVFC